MKRRDKEITDPDVLKRILRTAKHVTLALAKDNEPYLVSVSHGYDETRNCLYFHCAKEGKKLDYLRSNSTVWGQAMIDYGYAEGKCDHIYASVHFRGKATLIKDPTEKRRAIECMMRQLDKNPEALIAKLKPERLQEALLFRIDIDFMSGKKSEEANP